MKLCRDCNHLEGDNCEAPPNFLSPEPDYVNGVKPRSQRRWYGAQFCREDEKACGKEARWFEPKDKP